MSEQEIKEIVLKYVEAVHTQDKQAFYSIWSESPHCILISIAKQFVGIESIYNDFLIGLIQKRYSDIRLIADDIEIHLINDNLATVVFKYHTECIMRKDGSNYGIKGLETQVLLKEKGHWKILHIHYSKN